MGLLTSTGKRLIQWTLSKYEYDLVRKGQLGRDAFADIQTIYGKKRFNLVFDVGAHEGETLSEFRRLFRDAEIHCFEPTKDAFEVLRLTAGNDARVKLHHCALGEADGWATLFCHRRSHWNSLLENSSMIENFARKDLVDTTGTEQVELFALDSFCTKNNVSTIDLLKIDSQGYELKILNGAAELLKSKRVSLLHLEVSFAPYYEGQCSFEQLYSMLTRYQYKLVGLYCPVEHARDSDHSLLWGDVVFMA